MVAFNFHKRFAADVKAGRKTHSARQTRRCMPGDKIQLYTGQRTKSCQKLGEAICLNVEQLVVHQYYVSDSMRRYRKPLGFKNIKEMREFYCGLYGLPKKLWVHSWVKL